LDRELAVRLVDQVHHVLGRHRDDDPRSGWISGLSEKEGELHPNIGGLRIGKELNDGLVTYSELQMTAYSFPGRSSLLDLRAGIADMIELCRWQDLATDDPLGIGGLLFDASRIAQLMLRGGFAHPDLLERVVESVLRGVRIVERSRQLQLPAGYRLAFRELGLSIGMKGLDRLSVQVEGNKGVSGRRDPCTRRL
jgi:hypothetical protein